MARGFISTDVGNNSRQITIQIEKQFDISQEASMIREALKGVAQEFAKDWLENNRDKVMERLNVDAIANMILLEVAKETKEQILTHPKANRKDRI